MILVVCLKFSSFCQLLIAKAVSSSSSFELVELFEFLGLFHEDGGEFFQVELAVLVDVVLLDEPLGLLQADICHFWFLGGRKLAVWSAIPIGRFSHLVLTVGVELVLELQQRVHVLLQSLWAHSLVIIRKEAVHLVDLMVHLLCCRDVLHDVHQVQELDLALVSFVVKVNQVFDLLIWQVYPEASQQVFELASGDRAITVLIEQLEGFPVLLQGAIVHEVLPLIVVGCLNILTC